MRILFTTPCLPLVHRTRPFQFISRLAREHHVDVVAQDDPEALVRASA